jgi:ribonuclease E
VPELAPVSTWRVEPTVAAEPPREAEREPMPAAPGGWAEPAPVAAAEPPPVEPEPPAIEPAPPAADEPEKPRRTGWWRRVTR